MLVDSGADESTIPVKILDAAGVPYTGEEVEMLGVGGGKQVARVASARIEVAGYTYDGRFLASTSEDRIAVLGQRDFFLNFVVQFDRAAGLFFISRVNHGRA